MATIKMKLLVDKLIDGIERKAGDVIYVRPELVKRLKAQNIAEDFPSTPFPKLEPEQIEPEQIEEESDVNG